MKDWLPPVISNIIVIVGWYVVFQQAKSVKSREEIRDLVSRIDKTIDQIFSLCVDYYSEKNLGHQNFTSADIRAKFVLLSHLLIIIKDIDVNKVISPSLVQLRKNAMGGYFETVEYLDQLKIPNWKSDLAASASELQFRVEQIYFRHVGVLK